MNRLQEKVYTQFGNRVRVRVCALCFRGDDLLLVWHRGLFKEGPFVAPPGGGLHFGESAEQALRREVAEETGLEVHQSQFLFVYEYVVPPLHAVELFFSVKVTGGSLRTGTDPEMQKEDQIIEQVRFVSPQEISAGLKKNGEQFHQMIRYASSPKELLSLRGYFKFDNKTRN